MRIAGDRLQIREGRVSEVLPTLDGDEFAGCFHLAAAVGVRLVVDEPAGLSSARIGLGLPPVWTDTASKLVDSGTRKLPMRAVSSG